MVIKKAIDDLKKAMALNADNPYLHYDLGNAYALQKDYARAMVYYDKALKLDSRIAEAYYNRGLVKIALQQQTEGLKDLGKAGELGLYDAYGVIKQVEK